jgi:hypothetical protein
MAEGDTSRAASLVQRYQSLAAGSEAAREFELGQRLAFGDESERTAAVAEMDTVPYVSVDYLVRLLADVRHAEVQEPLHRLWLARPASEQPGARNPLMIQRVNRGRIRSFLDDLPNPAIAAAFRRSMLQHLELNHAVTAEVVDRQLKGSRSRTPRTPAPRSSSSTRASGQPTGSAGTTPRGRRAS